MQGQVIEPSSSQGTGAPARVPGAPVPRPHQVGRNPRGGQCPVTGDVPETAEVGIPDPGVVPVVGDADARADSGAYVVSETRVDDRLLDLMVRSPGLGGAAAVRVQLPPSWSEDPTRTYPVLYLLHGGAELAGYQAWSRYSRYRDHTTDLEMLVVMPAGGLGGHYSDYWNFGVPGVDQWGTFTGQELPQLLRRGYRAGDGAALAGTSSGGRAAFELVMRNPGAYGAAASYSGLLDVQMRWIARTIEFGPIADGTWPFAMWGSRRLRRADWTSRNPAANLDALRDCLLYVSAGGGARGPLDRNPGFNLLEATAARSTRSFARKAVVAGLDVELDLYGCGEHSWAYWDRQFASSLPRLRRGMGLT